MTWFTIALLAAMLSTTVEAQIIATTTPDGLLTADWKGVEKCAKAGPKITDAPNPQPGDADFIGKYNKRQEFEQAWRNAAECRMMLSARHAGYLEGQAAPKTPDPYPPVKELQ